MDRFLLIAGEILNEEELAIWMQFNPPAAQARAAAEEAARRRREAGTQIWPSVVSRADVPVFGDPAHEYEKFSPDTAWMPTTRHDRQEHLRLARPAQQALSAATSAASTRSPTKSSRPSPTAA